MKSNLSILALLIFVATSCNQTVETDPNKVAFPHLSGPYLGQYLPDTIPQLFAPGVVSTGMFTRDMAISPDGKEIYFCVSIGSYTFSTILCSKEVNGEWLPP